MATMDGPATDGPTTDRALDAAMRRATELGARSLGRTSPNPAVGAVVLAADGTPAGEGRHERAGGPHAEVVALAAAGEHARGGTAVVTLEPCATTGRTPPCTEALIAAGVARVVYAVADSTAAGGGAAVLRAAGIDVEHRPDPAAAELTEAWRLAVRLRRPYVTWKYAATLDGRVAAADGTSRWITSAEARADVHALRATVDAVLVGVGTVLADDPQLTVRDPAGALADRQPLRVVADRHRRTPADARVLDDSAETLVSAAEPATLLAELYARGVRHVLLEGGPTLAGSFVRQGLVDRVVGYVAPALLGAGPAALADAGVTTLDAAWRLRLDDVARIGPDVRLVARPEKEA